MIVVDTNVIAYLLLGGEKTAKARAAYLKDPVWAAPILWRSEFRNVLAMYLRRGELEMDDALELIREGEFLLEGRNTRWSQTGYWGFSLPRAARPTTASSLPWPKNWE